MGGFGGRIKSQKLAMNLGLSNSFKKEKKQKIIRSNLGRGGQSCIWGVWGIYCILPIEKLGHLCW